VSTPKIRDFLYFDLDKASSILSQFEWGLIEQISISQDETQSQDGGAKAGIPQIAELNYGVGKQKKNAVLETKKLHHDILNRIESQLTHAQLVVDLTSEVEKDETSPDHIREIIGSKPYVKAQGWSVIEDYQRILSITSRLNDIMGFIGQSQISTIKQNPEFIVLQSQIEAKRQEVKQIKDRNQKAIASEKLKALESQVEATIAAATKTTGIDQWLLDGIKQWIDTFMSNRINFRIYPFEQTPSFQVLCNLKRDCFVDQNLEHLLYGYGNRPNVPLAVFGLITSIPPKDKSSFNPMMEFNSNNSQDVAFEQGFREIFGAMEQFESFLRYSRYPNITIHPIAVFREFTAPSDSKNAG
jgi:hypothetical protein